MSEGCKIKISQKTIKHLKQRLSNLTLHQITWRLFTQVAEPYTQSF